MKLLGAAVAAIGLAGCAAYPEPGAGDIARVRTGMSRDDARQLLGTPLETMRFARSGTESWDYRTQDTWGYLVMTSVIFGPDGTVTGVVTQRLNDGGDHGTN